MCHIPGCTLRWVGKTRRRHEEGQDRRFVNRSHYIKLRCGNPIVVQLLEHWYISPLNTEDQNVMVKSVFVHSLTMEMMGMMMTRVEVMIM